MGVITCDWERILEVRGIAADAKKAESTSEVPLRTPRPPLRMDNLDRIHCVTVSDESVMELITSPSDRLLSIGNVF